MNLVDGAVVAAAALTAGVINSLAGGGTLVVFPALVAVGVPARTANMTSSVSLIWGYLGGSLGYRRELEGQRSALRGLVAAAVVGAGAGAAALLVTSAGAFQAAVPFLILLSCALFGSQERLRRKLVSRRADIAPSRHRRPLGAIGGVALSAGYGSYFGAGLGVLLLAVLGIAIDEDIQRLNALKSALSLVVNVVAVLVFIVAGDVSWAHAGVGCLAAFAGGRLGVGLARKLPGPALRRAVVVAGTAVAVVMLVRQ